jgi:hypothetical protein
MVDLMISAVILECEANWIAERANQNRRSGFLSEPIKELASERAIDITQYKDDWCRFIGHKLVYGCRQSEDLLNNKVNFITFNYDTSLECRLFEALTALDILNPDDVRRFLTEDRIIHVYGSVHSTIPTEEDRIDIRVAKALHVGSSDRSIAQDIKDRKLLLDKCWCASQSLLTIDPHNKGQNEEALKRARGWISNAGIVVILGYGFDENNSTRLGLENSLNYDTGNKHLLKQVLFTNFGDTSRVNKNASKLMFGNHSHLGTGKGPLERGGGCDYEKSVRNVYDARRVLTRGKLGPGLGVN